MIDLIKNWIQTKTELANSSSTLNFKFYFSYYLQLPCISAFEFYGISAYLFERSLDSCNKVVRFLDKNLSQ